MEISNGQEEQLMKSQAMSTHSLEELLNGFFRSSPPPAPEKKTRPEPEQSLKCPRCDSTNTKFCYYNNYSLSQPRYFCKGCRRYWTKGGTLRNVPVGGGFRKNRRSSSSSSSSSKMPQDDQTNILWPSFGDKKYNFFGNPNPNPNPNGFLSLMRSEIFETSNMNGFDEIYYGHNGRYVVEGMDLQLFNGAHHGGLGMEYSSLHDLVNGSLI